MPERRPRAAPRCARPTSGSPSSRHQRLDRRSAASPRRPRARRCRGSRTPRAAPRRAPSRRSRPVGRALAAADRRRLVAASSAVRQLAQQPRLADAGLADHRDQVRAALALDPLDQRDSSSPASSSRPISGVSAAHARRALRARRASPVASQAGTGSSLPFSVERLEPLVGDRLAGGAVGALADGDAARPPGGLQPRGDVDGVAHHRVAVADGARHHLAGVDPDPQREADAVARSLWRLTSSIASCIASPARTARSGSSSWATGAPKTPITLSPMNLSIDAAEALDLLAEPAQGAVDQRLDRLGVHALGGGRVAGEVGEQDGRLAALLGRRLGAAEGPRAQAGARRRRRARCRTPCRTWPRRGSPRRSWGRRASSSAPHDMQKRARSGFSAPQVGQALSCRHAIRIGREYGVAR